MADIPLLFLSIPSPRMLEVMHAIQRAGPMGAIKIVSRFERPASLSDKEAASGVAPRSEPEKI
jgi:hypothetical protein